MQTTACLSVGSNLNDRLAYLKRAIWELGAAEKVVAVSSFYETEPVEFTEQPWFINCAVKVETEKTPQQLMDSVLDIEREMGRERTVNETKKGPRIIDIDILLFGDAKIEIPGLSIPHPGLHNRRFVLQPLAEIASELRHPSLNRTIQELLEALPDGQIVRKIKG
ncbi:MAG: 2-amino-4-hydroxy-6-hydroxymethyldihydropteridine diphosphokinase [Acidobacteriota bacterium]|nr:2-amino-4-hydroxy-6-hydroxymethyldihydropteridine diphosphokinase [Acidobacteriota bacterium]